MNMAFEQAIEQVKVLAHNRDYPAALNRANELVAQHPDEMLIWDLRAYIYGLMGDYRSAVADRSRAIAIQPMEPALFWERGIDYFSLGEYQFAASDFTKTIELCDHYRNDYYRESAHFRRAEAYLQLGNKDAARADLARVRDDFRTWTTKLRSKQELLAECGG